MRGLTPRAVLASFRCGVSAVTRIQPHVTVLSRPGQIANAFVRVDKIQALSVGARIGLAVVVVNVAVSARIPVQTNATIKCLVIATIASVLTRIGQAPIHATFASKASETKRTVARESV